MYASIAYSWCACAAYMLSNQKSIARPTNEFSQYVGYCCIGNKAFMNLTSYLFQIT